MKNFAAIAACALSFPVAALAAPGIAPITETEGVSVRVVPEGSLAASARPRSRPDRVEPAAPLDLALLFPASERMLSGKGFTITPSKMLTSTAAAAEYVTASNVAPPVNSIFGTVIAPAQQQKVAMTPIEEATIGRLLARYPLENMAADDDAHVERIFMIAEGRRFSRIDSDGGVSVVNTAYEQEKPAASAQVQAPAPQASLPAQMGMTNEQFAAFMMAMANRPQTPSVYNVPPATMPARAPQAAAPLGGVPDLDYRGTEIPENAFISASDVPSGSSPFSPEILTGQPYPGQAGLPPEIAQMISAPAQPQVPQNSIIGDGGNILLSGWKVGLTGSGGVGLYIDGDPGSIVEISEGMVVGSLGSVENISFLNGEIIASFTSGESLRGPARIVMSPNVGVSGSAGDSDRMISG